MDLWQLLGSLHPRLVQFPLVLLPAGLIFDLAGWIGRSSRAHWAGKVLTLSGTVFLLLAFICGIYAEIWAGRAGVPQEPIEWHEFVANVASWGFVVLAAWRLLLDEGKRRAMLAYTLVGLAYFSLLVLTAYLGGKLVFSYGAGVTGARAATAMSLEDLNTLATRQTDLNLRYSEMMHHIFGWVTLALCGSLLAQAIWPKASGRLRWVGPALLLVGGVFLFFFADLDLYRFTDLRQLRDREVQLHKTLAVIMAIVGIVGLYRTRRPLAAALPEAGVSSSRASHLVAILALIGGGLLFTHVHTVAPYANVAAGVYTAHLVMGMVALGIGATRLAQDWHPRHRRGLALAFAGLMLVESLLLITYNEGPPWYVGIGHYNRWGAHGGTVAPYGPIRAELTYDPASAGMNVYVVDRFTEKPAPVPANALHVLIGRGYQETDVPLRATEIDPNGTAWHFQGTAAFLEDAPAFSARLALPVKGRMRMGYFDPWVAPAVAAVPPNEVARYQCPMHEGIRSLHPGKCPLCGMELIPIQFPPPQTLHDPAYGMLLAMTPARPMAGEPVQLKLTPQYQGRLFRDLAVVHEHLLHLIIVSSDLGYFDHIHPVLQPDGSLTITYAFPHAGRYLLFADTAPRGQRSQVFRLPVSVGPGEAEAKPVSLAISPALARGTGEYLTELICQPRSLTAGTHAELIFRLWREGQPVTDLQPYMGAMGHCVIISEDTQTYLHSHPEMLCPPKPDARGGPDVVFHAFFPRPGRYKVWGQFKRGDQILIADFVVQVHGSWLPPSVVRAILNE